MLIDLFNKRFIYINNLLITALILFIKKFKRSLQFYIDYKRLN